MKRVAVLNVGGDCPGLNAVIRALIVKGAHENIEVIGVYDGFNGLVNDKMFIMTKEHVSGRLPEGGIILGSSKFDPTNNPEDLKKLKENVERYQITSLILLTGHTGSRISLKLKDEGIPCLIIPATIDNDLVWSDLSIGFLTALQTVTDSLDSLHSTASAGHRVIVVEVGGDESGWLATIGGMAGGADYIVTPEITPEPEDILLNIKRRYEVGKKFSIIVVEERSKLTDEILKVASNISPNIISKAEIVAEYIKEKMGDQIDVRTVNLGYLQRGGSPVSFDRFLAFKFGFSAIECIKKGKSNIALGLKGFEILEEPLSEKVTHNKAVKENIYEMAKLFF
ncbi:ATP-dependent 6-phosphofructokinase [Oceanotoga sp. DSM 15011]|jgi:6-phosphofructokinase 1|uniref:6-phosphofructokinase 1 n=1 Tax=Oceanotoga teriensis TaxID=515440 RepID=A0AA45HJ98_9BACT|nr:MULTISPECIES: ATP-dependent 6-phosphofructokinase [Oceanotoga]MDN5341170.1 ATP-dependent phosphofructokinase / diphosphate-dependent phosphofructokinase [Oceanotoga sp.]MDO7976851.1 ATP-dependent 6-phosphofructokinase [Oceanotoga teriensis]PWJ95928.1 6-phosphofructokinase 1 [Oceanotoga teriensis]UYP00846.1 ATP-dependent 6-phosphofructokinase [Oceanotoga sp. DSM 15011]